MPTASLVYIHVMLYMFCFCMSMTRIVYYLDDLSGCERC